MNIIAKRWFQKTYGNTYHSVTIYVNDEVLYKPFAYGYDDQYIVTAAEMLESAGYDLERNTNDYLHDGYRALYNILRNKPECFESVRDVARKKDL